MTSAGMSAAIAALLVAAVLAGAAAGAETFTVRQAVEYALAHNKALVAKKEDVNASLGRVRDAWSAALPKVNVEAGYTRLSEVPVIDISVPAFTTAPGMPPVKPDIPKKEMGALDNYKAEIKLNQILFASGQVAAAIRSAKAGDQAAREAVTAEQDDLTRRIHEAFYTVLLAQEVFESRKEALSISEEHLSDVRKRYNVGAASRYELLRSELEAANLRPEVTRAENNVRIVKTGLKSLMGYDLGAPIDVSGSLEEPRATPAYEDAFGEALTARHILKALDKSYEAQHQASWAATAGMLPKLVGTASWGYQKPYFFENDWKDLWSVGVGLTIPVFDGLSAWGRRTTSGALARQIKKQREVVVEGIDLEIRRALLDLKEIGQRIDETRSNVERSKDVYQMAETSYQNGAATNLEILDAQLAMTSARIQYLQALYDYQIANTKILAAAGLLGN